jgi:hypothetical protein
VPPQSGTQPVTARRAFAPVREKARVGAGNSERLAPTGHLDLARRIVALANEENP